MESGFQGPWYSFTSTISRHSFGSNLSTMLLGRRDYFTPIFSLSRFYGFLASLGSQYVVPSSIVNVEDHIHFFIDLSSSSHLSPNQKLLPFLIMWRIWRVRNNLIFNNQIPNPKKEVGYALADVQEWLLATNMRSDLSSCPSIYPPSQTNASWRRPPVGLLKCNFDASFNLSSKQVVGGWILRDNLGVTKFWGSAVLGYASTPLEAEAKSLLMAIYHTKLLGFSSVNFEGDCLRLINCLLGKTKEIHIHNLCNEITLWTNTLHFHQFSYTKRCFNEPSHLLAKHGPPNQIFHSDCIHPLPWLTLNTMLV